QAEAMTLGTRVAVMQHGRIVQVGAPLDLYRNPRHRFVATFLGSPPMNLLDEVRDGKQVQVAFHPEDVSVSVSTMDGSEQADVIVVEPMGSETLVTLEYRSQRLVARVPGDVGFNPGETVWIR